MNEDRLKRIEDTTARIERCLLGDEAMGQFGLVSRVNNHASRIKRLERWALYVFAVSAVLGVVYKIVVDFWPHI